MIEESQTIKFGKKTFVNKFEGLFLDNYEVLKQLGKGGYGQVYEVKNRKSGDIRSCKYLSKSNFKNKEKFEREINILINTDHPNIIKIYELYESDEYYYLVMEECKGGELCDRIIEHIQAKRMYSEKEAAIILQQVMSAIEYCHYNGICHRDLKPENLLYFNEGQEQDNPIKVIDFGLSQLVSPDKKMTEKVGSIYYFPPEVLKGNYTEKCDIWSAGVILYLLLSGEMPFNGPTNSTIFRKISKMKYTYPEKVWNSISNEAKDLIDHMIAPESERYSARQVLQHPWFKKGYEPLKSFSNFQNVSKDDLLVLNLERTSQLKNMILLYIASRLDENEVENLKKFLEDFDKSKEGKITYEELKQGLVQLKNKNINENYILELSKSFNIDQNDKFNYTEFLDSTIKKIKNLRNERIFVTFCVLDKDNSGYISKDELLYVLKKEKIQEVEIEASLKIVDKGDGKIDYKKFLELMNANKN